MNREKLLKYNFESARDYSRTTKVERTIGSTKDYTTAHFSKQPQDKINIFSNMELKALRFGMKIETLSPLEKFLAE